MEVLGNMDVDVGSARTTGQLQVKDSDNTDMEDADCLEQEQSSDDEGSTGESSKSDVDDLMEDCGEMMQMT